jgi:protein phosphatase
VPQYVMKKIPLNSLVVLIDVAAKDIAAKFPDHEFVSIERVQDRLTGGSDRPDLRSLFMREVEHEVNTKLSLGERVVVDIPDLRRDVRMSLARIAVNKGMSVFYIVDDLNIRRDLVRGDKLADVIDIKRDVFEAIVPLEDDNLFKQVIARGYEGITVVPDIHGSLNTMLNAIRWAYRRNNFLLFLGDLLDYGLESLETVEEAYRLVTRGEAEVINGNHEKKIYRWITQRDGASHIKLSEANKVTTQRIEALSATDMERWTSRFKALYNMSRNHRIAENFAFTHGAIHHDIWRTTAKRVSGKFEEMCLFGEVDNEVQRRADGFPNRIYRWVDKLPKDHIAIVGHDIRSTNLPLIQQGASGGQAIFLDTGCSKSGHLSTVDIRFVDGIAKVSNFNAF